MPTRTTSPVTVVHTTLAPAPAGPYAQAAGRGEVLALAGQLGTDPDTRAFAEGAGTQTRQALANLAAVLDAAGASFTDVIRVGVYLADWADFAAINAAYAEALGGHRPARTTVGVNLPPGALVEIDALAVRPAAPGTAPGARGDDAAVGRWAAFAAGPGGGNPAGVVLEATGMDDAAMQDLAARIGYSETVFVQPDPDRDTSGRAAYQVRYFSPQREVSFCGHATIAAAVALADRSGPGDLLFDTLAGAVPVTTARTPEGTVTATLTSVAPEVGPLSEADLAALLAAVRWEAGDLDPALPPRVVFAGARHPVIAAATRDRLADLDYDTEALTALMAARGWDTIDLIWRETDTLVHARNPFPVGGIYEDPATGAAAAATGAYLHMLGHLPGGTRVTILQGFDMGCPSRILVDLPEHAGAGIAVTGTAHPMPEATGPAATAAGGRAREDAPATRAAREHAAAGDRG
ncbi:PhzF family phenazine biosynthesis isomerase [Glycomyces sp. MUSA5-2]|uniref:PhzF family phenazine biosynthesis isomerase n=1 Tax=Glycomyces sp. MUSA5-2 TaxID=2053002 RepID=UPI00300B5F95